MEARATGAARETEAAVVAGGLGAIDGTVATGETMVSGGMVIMQEHNRKKDQERIRFTHKKEVKRKRSLELENSQKMT